MAVQEFRSQENQLFAGAVDFPCGGKPLVDSSDEKLLFIGSKRGVEVFINDEFGESENLFYCVRFPTQAGCRAFMTFLPSTISELKEMGFIEL